MNRKCLLVIVTLGFIVASSATHSQASDWQFEITPYMWFSGIDGDVSVGDRTAEVDVGFDDIIKNVDMASLIMLTAQKGQLVLWGQFDYISMNDSGSTAAGKAEVDIDQIAAAGGVGWQFLGGLTERATTDVLIGARHLSISTEIDVSGVGSREGDRDVTDAILIVRPSIPMGEKWRFNPTFSIGAGDSDIVWELQPHFQYHFNETWAGRIGYRRLHYKVPGDRVEFDGAFHGFILGFGATL